MSYININFNVLGQQKLIDAKSDMMIAELIYKFLQKTGIQNVEQFKFFIYKSKEIDIFSAKSLEEFGFKNLDTIDVVKKDGKS